MISYLQNTPATGVYAISHAYKTTTGNDKSTWAKTLVEKG
jgi:hypothetical protein